MIPINNWLLFSCLIFVCVIQNTCFANVVTFEDLAFEHNLKRHSIGFDSPSISKNRYPNEDDSLQKAIADAEQQGCSKLTRNRRIPLTISTVAITGLFTFLTITLKILKFIRTLFNSNGISVGPIEVVFNTVITSITGILSIVGIRVDETPETVLSPMSMPNPSILGQWSATPLLQLFNPPSNNEILQKGNADNGGVLLWGTNSQTGAQRDREINIRNNQILQKGNTDNGGVLLWGTNSQTGLKGDRDHISIGNNHILQKGSTDNGGVLLWGTNSQTGVQGGVDISIGNSVVVNKCVEKLAADGRMVIQFQHPETGVLVTVPKDGNQEFVATDTGNVYIIYNDGSFGKPILVLKNADNENAKDNGNQNYNKNDNTNVILSNPSENSPYGSNLGDLFGPCDRSDGTRRC